MKTKTEIDRTIKLITIGILQKHNNTYKTHNYFLVFIT